MTDLRSVACALVQPGKGLLAADESVATETKRLAPYGIPATGEARRAYRDLFLSTPGIEAYLSGVILFEETLEQKGSDDNFFVTSLAARGIAPGIKVDTGTEPLPGSPEELITNGLLDLSDRLTEYKKRGTTFTKWRAVIRIEGDRLPTAQAVLENVKRLATSAKVVQEHGLVPILEPEVLMEGTHARARARAVIEEVLGTLFATLKEQSVDIASILLKTSMAVSGSAVKHRDAPPEVAEDTLAALLATVPKKVPGIVFLSGGQTPDEATENLSAICRLSRQNGGAPWPLTFSFARGLQEEALALWRGKEENVPKAREAFLARLKKLSEAVS